MRITALGFPPTRRLDLAPRPTWLTPGSPPTYSTLFVAERTLDEAGFVGSVTWSGVLTVWLEARHFFLRASLRSHMQTAVAHQASTYLGRTDELPNKVVLSCICVGRKKSVAGPPGRKELMPAVQDVR